MKNYFSLGFLTSLVLIILLFGIMACDKDESSDEPIKTNADKIIGTWQITDDDYNGIITFRGHHAYDYFTHDTLAGVAMYAWNFINNKLSMNLQWALGDYEEYNEITMGDNLNAIVEITDNELSIDYNDDIYVYTRMAPENLISETDIEGTWQLEDGNYLDLITFEVNQSEESLINFGTEAFLAEADSGASNFKWNVNGDMIFMSYENNYMLGDFESYNEIGTNEMIISKVSATDNQLTFTVNNEPYSYTKVLSENIISISDLLGYWKLVDGTLTEIISFQMYGSYGRSTHSFIDGDFTGSVGCSWTVSGDLFSIEYESPKGDFSSYFDISVQDYISMRISYANNQLIFHSPDGDYTYTRMDESEITTNSEIVGTWERIDGNYIGELTFNDDGTGLDSFTDGAQAGTAEYYCLFNGNILRLHYSTLTGDYGSYNGISAGENIYFFISLTGNQLTITNDGVEYVYTKSSK